MHWPRTDSQTANALHNDEHAHTTLTHTQIQIDIEIVVGTVTVQSVHECKFGSYTHSQTTRGLRSFERCIFHCPNVFMTQRNRSSSTQQRQQQPQCIVLTIFCGVVCIYFPSLTISILECGYHFASSSIAVRVAWTKKNYKTHIS